MFRSSLTGLVSACVCVTANVAVAANAAEPLFHCSITGFREPVFISIEPGGTTARIGTAIGIGGRATATRDRFGAWVFVESNSEGSPITLTTIQKDLTVAHSRHVLDIDGTILVPSQYVGTCKLQDR